MFDLKADASRCDRSRRLGGDTGFGEISSTTSSCPTRDVIGEANDGLARRDEHIEHERGMSLRSPAASSHQPSAG